MPVSFNFKEKRQTVAHQKQENEAIQIYYEGQNTQAGFGPHISSYFVSHLLQANYNIRTIQELLGHGTTKEGAKSPLDFRGAKVSALDYNPLLSRS